MKRSEVELDVKVGKDQADFIRAIAISERLTVSAIVRTAIFLLQATFPKHPELTYRGPRNAMSQKSRLLARAREADALDVK